MDPFAGGLVTNFYRALLWLYPASFRADYGAELTSTFEQQTRDRSRAGAMLAAIADVVPNALAAGIEPMSALRAD